MISQKETSLSKITENASTIWLTLSIEEHQLSLIKINEVNGSIAFGDYFPNEEVPVDTVGHWVEVLGHYNQVLYRRFIHNKLPLHLADKTHKEQKSTHKNIQIAVPKLPQASHITFWEQTSRCDIDGQPSRQPLLNLPFNEPLAQAV